MDATQAGGSPPHNLEALCAHGAWTSGTV